MKTILALRENIARLWGKPKPEDKKYRLMKYLLKCRVEDGILLHNNVTGHLVLLDNYEAELLSELPAKPNASMQDLIANHFLVPEDFDEYRSANQLRSIAQKQSTGSAITHYIILPTTFCNAHCFYCYESDYPRVQMSKETAHKVVDFIHKHSQGKKVSLSWFGGEPLVGIARIDQISQELTDLGIAFNASMVSNAYLFDDEVVKRSVDLWHLERVQVTLDGTEEVYNRVKAYMNPKDNPYQRVISNIDKLSDHKIYVSIRLNVDFYNKDEIRLLIEELGKRYSKNQYVMVYMNMLFSGQGYEPVIHTDNEKLQLLQIIDEYKELLKELNVNYEGQKIPYLQTMQCMADDPHSIEIQPDGSFCRCEHESILDNYGNLDEGVLDEQKLLKWKETVERSDFCPECKMYPACYLLRNCMSGKDVCDEGVRLRGEQRLIELIQSVYKKGLEVKNNEGVCNS